MASVCAVVRYTGWMMLRVLSVVVIAVKDIVGLVAKENKCGNFKTDCERMLWVRPYQLLLRSMVM